MKRIVSMVVVAILVFQFAGVAIADIDMSVYERFINASDAIHSESYGMALFMLSILNDTLTNENSRIYGMVGREQYKEAKTWLIGDNVKNNSVELETALSAANRYLTDDVTGVGNFYDDLVEAGFIDSHGHLEAYIVDMAEGLGITENMVHALIDELNLYQSEENQITVSSN